MLFMAAKHQASRSGSRSRTVRGTTLILTHLRTGDLATYLAEDAGHAFRDHVTNPQTFFEALFEQLPDVALHNPATGRRFNDGRDDPGAAAGRNPRGLRLAGLLNEAPKPDGVG